MGVFASWILVEKQPTGQGVELLAVLRLAVGGGVDGVCSFVLLAAAIHGTAPFMLGRAGATGGGLDCRHERNNFQHIGFFCLTNTLRNPQTVGSLDNGDIAEHDVVRSCVVPVDLLHANRPDLHYLIKGHGL